MPAVEEANSISEELDKRVKFEIILIAPNKLGELKGKAEGFDKKALKSKQPEVCVKMKNLENGTEFIWPKEKFLNRLYLMKEMYNNYEEEDDWDLPEEKDPFQEDLNQEVCIGTAQVFLQVCTLVSRKNGKIYSHNRFQEIFFEFAINFIANCIHGGNERTTRSY